MMPTYPYRFSLLLIPLLWQMSVSTAKAQEFAVYDSLPQLTSRIHQAGEATLVINFWATWCKPCVEELPCFEQLREQYAEKNVQILLVSLDFKSQLEKKLIPFLKAQQLKSEVVLFADQDVNTWIPYIYEEWDGAIPVTLIVKGRQKAFNLGKFESYTDLEAFVVPFIGDAKAISLKNLINCSSGK